VAKIVKVVHVTCASQLWQASSDGGFGKHGIMQDGMWEE